MTAGQEPRSETPVDVIAASPSDAVPTTKRGPRVWTVFVVYVAAILGAIILQALVVAVYIGAYVAGGADLKQLIPRLPELLATPQAFIILTLLSQCVIGLAAFVPAWLSPEPTRARLGWVRPALRPWAYPVVAVGSLIPLAVGLGLAYALSFMLAPDTSTNGLYERMTWAAAVPFLVVIMLAPGFFEESLFRGYIQRRLLQRWSAWVAIAVTTMLFALMHVTPHAVLAMIPFGAWLGVLAWRTGSVWPGVVCHAFVNGAWSVWQIGQKLADWPEVPPTVVAAGAGAVAVGCFLASVWILAQQRGPSFPST
jgi:membrane protease YdiL (CAAX protease family)